MHAKSNPELIKELDAMAATLDDEGAKADRADVAELLRTAALRLSAMRLITPAIADVIHERERQQEQERFGPQHDDQHRDRSLAYAASAYLGPVWRDGDKSVPPVQWGWGAEWWKPGGDDAESERRRAVKGAALAIAEIDRLDRDAARRHVEG